LLSPHRQELRRELGVRRALVETRAQYVTTIRGLIRERGQSLRTCNSDYFVSHVRKAPLSDEVRTTIEPLVATLEGLEKQLTRVEVRIEQLCAT
jgi:transposase